MGWREGGVPLPYWYYGIKPLDKTLLNWCCGRVLIVPKVMDKLSISRSTVGFFVILFVSVWFAGRKLSQGFCWRSSLRYDRGQSESILPTVGRSDRSNHNARPGDKEVLWCSVYVGCSMNVTSNAWWCIIVHMSAVTRACVASLL